MPCLISLGRIAWMEQYCKNDEMSLILTLFADNVHFTKMGFLCPNDPNGKSFPRSHFLVC
jgi:hypothetical protein